MWNVSTFDEQLKEHSYREDTVRVVKNWNREKLQLFLNNLRPDQYDEPLPRNMNDMSTEDLRKLTCLVVWEWGWEGSDYFYKMHS